MKALKTLSSRHLHRILDLKANIDKMEAELCRLLHLPPSLVAGRDRARSKLVPPLLRRQIAAAEQARRAGPGQSPPAAGDCPPSLWQAHLDRKAAVRSRIKKTAAAGWNKIRRTTPGK